MKGDEWRSARHGMTPALSSHKMKQVCAVQHSTELNICLCSCVIAVYCNLLQMEPMIRDSAHSLLEKFEEVAGTGKTLNMTE